ncbi:MAG: LLM class flavin-dependent oxidoreductase [Pseudomonadales bacterium]|jgi:alkanesulfonate monooxygenase SsuD/methylene tetrahydromethanopterin reductase-like flavin-dependent oxidoreductase (luciferase family)|nr:LLM class flavin-dependent oxidoreductase [Pseudomonadales bacterium]MDP6472732.1 LLM class flavin-dependent oxidoreductase [Pseudomonadales bacterium]MDP6827945.1 LLM class flavin-dependent oxidoreductase [Pseudomonadales bacterium]MDP6973108.1 LLM class flavin-dependent oxidoreductase [Pseudomonadales bacterium]|tara:strand:+ start:288 stop:1346 length:1059 start_codon:yes stop_codon:yes gene_type:complete
MELGICVASHVGDIGYVVRAEELGYTHAWLADSQMLWSDCYAALALAASQTSTINLGTGVAITGTRPAPVNAAGIATINALAPGRTFFGVGAGNTAMRVMGLPPDRIAQYDTYLGELKPLLKGEESLHRDIPIKHIMPDKGFVNFEDEIPMYVSGFGPRSLALAGKHGDGAVIAAPAMGAVLSNIWHMIESGAREAGRVLDRDAYYTTALTTMVVLAPGEASDSERVKAQCGAMAMATVHYAYDQYRNFGHQPPGVLSGIWEDYTAQLEAFPAERRHQRIHAGHNCWVLPEEERFLTPEVLSASSMIGTRDELVELLHGFAEEGLDQVMILPNFDTRFDVLEQVGEQILPYV